MSTSIHTTVNTTPMAHSIDGVSHRVQGTTEAVVAMQSAVIVAEKKAADHVCTNVNRGFHSLIRSQISQKMAALRSEVDSQLMQLNQKARQLNGVRQRMERDYRMLAQRYTKLFTAINRNLEQRVTELDRPTLNFASRDIGKLSNRTHLLAATVPVSQEESVADSQKLIAGNLKRRGENLLRASRNFLEDSRELRIITDKILLPERIRQASQNIYYPVVVSQSVYDASGNAVTRVEVTAAAEGSLAPTIRSAVNAALPGLNWSEPHAMDENLANEMNRLAASAQLPPRVAAMVRKMIDSTNCSTLKA